MKASPTTWDYSGVVAAAYDAFFGGEPFWDQPLYEQRLRANGGRALEIGCGTGRLLLPLLRDGLQVEGLDTSHDMLERLRAKARAMNLAPRVHQLPMQDFDLPDRYRTVFVPACSFQILVDPLEVRAALAAFRRALRPGGELLLPIDALADDDAQIDHWRERRRAVLPEDGSTVTVFERSQYDRATGLLDWHLRWEVERPQRPREVFHRHHRLRRYRPDEFAALLAGAGFEAIAVRRGYTDPPSSDPAENHVFSARRPPGP